MKSRFPIVELGKYVRQVSQRNRAEADIEVFSVTNSEGFTKSTDYFSKEVFSKDVSNYKVVNPGQFSYNPSRINVGSIDYLRQNSSVLVSPLYIVFECSNDIHADYLLRYLKSDWGRAQIRSNTEGAVRDSLKFKGLENIKIPLPSHGDQIRIAGLLGKVEGLIAKRKQHLQQSDYLLQSVFLEIFDHIGDWPSMTLSSIAADGKGTFSNGPFGSNLLTSELTNTGVPVIYIRDIREARYKRVSTVCITEKKAKELVTCIAKPGDILVAKVGDPPGTAAIYSIGEPIGVVTQDVIRLRPNTKIVNAEYVTSLLNSHIGRQLIRGITVEATRARFGLKDFKMQKIPVPPMSLQIKFASIVQKIESLKSSYQQSLTDLVALYGVLIQQAFKGELDLSQVKIPRPSAIEAKQQASLTATKSPSVEDIELLNKQIELKHTHVKRRAGNHMSKQIMKVVDALIEAGGPLSGQQLLSAAGYPADSNTEVLEEFFLDIRDSLVIDKSIVKLERMVDGQDLFNLAGDFQSIARK